MTSDSDLTPALLRANYVEELDETDEATVAEYYYRYTPYQVRYSSALNTRVIRTSIETRNLDEIPADQWSSFVISLFTNIGTDLHRAVAIMAEQSGDSADLTRPYYARLVLSIPETDRAVSIPYVNLSENLAARILTAFDQWLQSNKSLILEKGIMINLTHTVYKKGEGGRVEGGGYRRGLHTKREAIASLLSAKKSVLAVDGRDRQCLLRGVVIAKLYATVPDKLIRTAYRRNPDGQQAEDMISLRTSMGLDDALTTDHLPLIQSAIEGSGFNLVVFSDRNDFEKPTFVGTRDRQDLKNIYLLLTTDSE